MNRIKLLRQSQTPRMSQEKLASLIGVGRTTVTMWENGKNEIDNATLVKLASLFHVSIDYILGRDNKRESEAGVKIPVLGDVAAGIPIEAVQDIVDYEEIDAALADTGEFFGLRLKGSSMEPRMKDGDVVIVRKQDTAETGDVAVVLVNGDSATVKRIKKEPSGITLIPNNPAYDSMYYSNSEIDSLPVRILGKVVELRAKF